MAATEPQVKNLADLYELGPLDWADVRRPLEANLTQEPGSGGPGHHTFWLANGDADGRPRMTAVGAFWLDGKYYFSAGPKSRKARNVERDPQCALGVAVHGYDVALEGQAHRVMDHAMLQKLAGVFAEGGWAPTVATAASLTISAPRAPVRRPGTSTRCPRVRLRRRHQRARRGHPLVILIERLTSLTPKGRPSSTGRRETADTYRLSCRTARTSKPFAEPSSRVGASAGR